MQNVHAMRPEVRAGYAAGPARTAVLAERGIALGGHAGAVDGRPVEAGGDHAVLAPCQLAWMAG